MNKPNKVILHCSATPDKGNWVNAEVIDDWHRDRGWRCIGYHWVIKRDGVIEKGREENEIGAHARGHNKGSIGVCLVGTKDFTSEQVSSLKVLFKEIKNRHSIDYNNWFCHYEFANKDCPNIPNRVLRELLRLS